MGEAGAAGPEAGARVRRAELVALLSLGTDLGLGQPMEHMIRACLIALRLAERAGLDDAERGVVYYSGLLAWVGCHTDAYEQAKWLGDDWRSSATRTTATTSASAGPAAAFLVKHVGGAGRPLLAAGPHRRCGSWATGGARWPLWRRITTWPPTSWPRASVWATRCGQSLQAELRALGRQGRRTACTATRSRCSSRLINLADVVEVFRRTGGIDAAVAVARERSGTQFDPELVDLFCQRGAADLRRPRRRDELGPGDRRRAVAGRGLGGTSSTTRCGDRRVRRAQVAVD